jgi:threonine dehydratase
VANRRQFLASSLLLSGVVFLPEARAQAAWEQLVAPGVELFLYDMRFEDATVLAKVAQQNSIQIADISGDLMDAWYDNLELRWKDAPMTLAGVTTARTLFVLETLAADHGMAVVHRLGDADLTGTQYAPLGDNALVQWIIAPRGGAPRP